MATFVFLFLVAFLGGALNAVAGGGSFLTLPALMAAGVGPVSASATSTLAMWPASLSSAVAYRREIARAASSTVRLGVVSLAGGLLGGLLLVRTSDASFLALLPWLMLVAAAMFTFGGRVTAWVAARRSRSQSRLASASAPRRQGTQPTVRAPQVPLWSLALQLLIATYGGYFGGGMGIMMLAAMSVAGMRDIHEMNGLKAVLAIAINGVALAAFVTTGAISWAPGAVMVLGGVAGGFTGASAARRIAGTQVRAGVIVVAWAMTLYFFWR